MFIDAKILPFLSKIFLARSERHARSAGQPASPVQSPRVQSSSFSLRHPLPAAPKSELGNADGDSIAGIAHIACGRSFPVFCLLPHYRGNLRLYALFIV